MNATFNAATQITPETPKNPVPIMVVDEGELKAWLAEQQPQIRAWVKANGFEPKAGSLCLIPSKEGKIGRVLYGRNKGAPDIWRIAALPTRLPQASYVLEAGADPAEDVARHR